MAATVAHETDTSPYATREEIDALWGQLQAVVDALHIEMRSMAEALGLPARPAHPLQPARSGLRLVASEGERLILEAARR